MTVKTKFEFIYALRKALQWRVLPCDAKDLLQDCAAFFDEGGKDGKSEAALCQEFGRPNQIAEAMAASGASPRCFPLNRNATWLLAGCFLLWVIYVIVSQTWMTVGFLPAVLHLPILSAATAALIWLLFGGELSNHPSNSHPSYKRSYFLWQYVLPVFTVLSYQLLLALSRYWLRNPAVINAGPRMARVCGVILLCLLAISVFAAAKFHRGNVYMLAILIQALGNIGPFFMFLKLLYTMDPSGDTTDQFSFLLTHLPNPILPLVLPLLFSGLYLLITWNVRKKAD